MEGKQKQYQKMSLKSFVDCVGARTSLPGGGSVSALVASLGSALACMSALLTYGNRKFEDLDANIREVLPSFYDVYQELVDLVDQDSNAFNSYMVGNDLRSIYFLNKLLKIDQIKGSKKIARENRKG